MDGEDLRKLTYSSIEDLSVKLSRQEYQLFMEELFERNVSLIKKKKRIKAAFFLPSSAYFSCEAIYREFEKNPLYEPYLVLIFHYQDLKENMKQESIKFFQDMCDYFKDLDYRYIVAYNPVSGRSLDFSEIGSPELIFHPYPYTERYFGRKLSLQEIPLSSLNVYIPYGIHVVNRPLRQFNREIHRAAFKIYCETIFHKQLAEEHSLMGAQNVVVSGYVKMDDSYKPESYERKSIWKSAGTALCKIIYAPHHSLQKAMGTSGTFHKNSEFFYELAKKVPEISWVIKPHPALRVRSVERGLYKSAEEYDGYMRRWSELPNAAVLQEGSYLDVFATSDAMIFDSLSFMSEYIYYHKPSLFLTSRYNDFNVYGKLVLDLMYTVKGTDSIAIASFIQDVVVLGGDFKKEKREEFFSKYLDYKTINGRLAAEMIYADIDSYFSKSNDIQKGCI